MNCDQIKLFELIRGDLNRIEAEKATNHLVNCGTCRERLRIMAVLEEIHSRKRATHRIHTLLPVAASIMLLCILPFLFRSGKLARNGLGSVAITDAYPYVALDTRSESSIRQPRDDAFAAYSRGDYQRAFFLLEHVDGDSKAAFFRGVSAYQMGRFSAARKAFRDATNLDQKWAGPANWYLANLELKAGNLDEAVRILVALSKNSGPMAPRARQLLKELEQTLQPSGRSE